MLVSLESKKFIEIETEELTKTEEKLQKEIKDHEETKGQLEAAKVTYEKELYNKKTLEDNF